MNKIASAQQAKTASFLPANQGILQRTCASCGNHTVAGGECTGCAKNKSGLQRKLAIGASHDPLEREADRVADQVMAASARSAVSGAPPHIQCFSGQSNGQMDAAPASVDQALASPGRPLAPALRQNMEQRFGHDFSRVRVHADEQASASARSVDARAYTVESHVVFGTNQYAPGISEGQRLLAHELAHVIQQGFAPREPGPSPEMRQNASGLRTNQGALLRRCVPPLLQRAPPAASTAKVQVKDEPHHAAEDVRDRAPVPSARTREKIWDFNEHNSDLGSDVLSKIQSGILKVTGKAGTDEVAYSFFDFYSSTGKSLRKMTPDEEKKAKVSDRLAETSPGTFATTTLRSDALSFDAVKLANLLLHEFAHTGDTAGDLSGAGSYQEGHAYGIEYFYARIAGDVNRANTIQGIVADGTVLGYSKTYDLARFQEDFKVTYALMTALREVVTNGSSSHLPFPKLTSASAQLLEQQVVVNFQNPSGDLKTYIAHVKATLGSFEIPRVN